MAIPFCKMISPVAASYQVQRSRHEGSKRSCQNGFEAGFRRVLFNVRDYITL
jgi:hypothetical protein